MDNLNFMNNPKKRLVVFSIVLLAFYAFIFLPQETFLALLREDSLFEYLTAIFFLIVAISFFMLFAKTNYLKTTELKAFFNTRSRRWVFLVLGLIFFFGFGEEISWGQRIIGFDAPALQGNNAQNEFNVHNLEIFNIRGTDGVKKGTLGMLFTMKQLFIYCFFIYLFIIPLFDKYNAMVSSLFKRFFIPVPPIWLGILFIGNYVIYRFIRIFTDPIFDGTMKQGLTEMQEFNFSVILLLLPFSWLMLSKFNKSQNIKNTAQS